MIGWAAALVAVVPMVIGGALHPQFFWRRAGVGRRSGLGDLAGGGSAGE